MLAIVNGRLILPDERAGGRFEAISGLALLIEDGRIAEVMPEVRLRADHSDCPVWDAGGGSCPRALSTSTSMAASGQIPWMKSPMP